MKLTFLMIGWVSLFFCLCSNQISPLPQSSSFPGCISIHTINDITNCYACDSINNWMYQAPYSCVCKLGYTKMKKSDGTYYCKLKCGDGILTEEQCDDGNNYDQDGCSSVCNRENDFKCENVRFQTSICRYIPQLTATVYSLSRKYGTNHLVLKISIQPFHPIIMANNWPQNILVNTSKITFHSHEFQDNSILVLNYQINESVEKQTLKWTFNYDSDKFLSQSDTLEILMKGMNAPLTFEPFYKHEKTLEILSYVVGGIALLIGIVAMVKAESNIAFELVTTVLFVFYVRIISYQHNPAILYTLSGLRIAGDFNEFFPDEHRNYLDYVFKTRFFITSELGLMTLFSLSLLGLLLIFKVAFQLKSLFNLITADKIQTQNMKQNKKEWKTFMFFTQAFNKYLMLQKKFSVPIMLICLYTIMCAFNNYQNTGDCYDCIQAQLGPITTNIILLWFFFVLIYYLAVGASAVGSLITKINATELNKSHKKSTINITIHQTPNDYADLKFLYLFVLSTLIFFTTELISEQIIIGKVIESCFIIILIYTAVLLIFKPYAIKLHMIAIALHEVVKMLFLLFLYLLQKQMLSELIELIFCYATLGLLLILQVISIVRIKKSWIEDALQHQNQQMKEAFKKTQNQNEESPKKPKKKPPKNNTENVYLYENIKKKQAEQGQQKQTSLKNVFDIIGLPKNSQSKTYSKRDQFTTHDLQSERERLAIFDRIKNEQNIDYDTRKQQFLQLQILKSQMRKFPIKRP